MSCLGKSRAESDLANERANQQQPNLPPQEPINSLNGQAGLKYNDIMAAIYWDLNVACYFPKVVQGKPEDIDWTMIQDLHAGVSNFMERTFAQLRQQLVYEPQDRSGRIYLALDQLGWKIFTICAHAEAFRAAIENESDNDWHNLLSIIVTEQRSIEIFARTRDLEWRGPLLSKAGGDWPGLREALAPEINLATEHPHHVVQTESGGLRRPMFPWDDSAKPQVNIKGNFFAPGPNKVDRLVRKPAYGKCSLCGSGEICDCDPIFVASDFIELREYPGQGAGTRALANFSENMCLGEYNGELCNESKYPGDDIFSMQVACGGTEPGQIHRFSDCNVDPSRFGSWTRFSNHHCDQHNANATCFNAGDRSNIVFRSRKDIPIFEQVRIDYGPGYWSAPSRICQCGSDKCVSNRWRRT